MNKDGAMDKNLIEIAVGSQTVYVETTSPGVIGGGIGESAGGPRPYSVDAGPAGKVAASVEESLGILQALGKALQASLKDVGAKEAEATLSVKFSASGKLIIAQGSAEASISIKLKFVP